MRQHVSVLPIVDRTGKLVGTISENDLLAAAPLAAGNESQAFTAASSSGKTAADIMCPVDLTFRAETPLAEAVEEFKQSAAYRIPVTRRGVLIGMVTRTDVLRGMVAYRDALAIQKADRRLRERILARLQRTEHARSDFDNFTVTDGIVHFWGSPPTNEELEIVRIELDSYGSHDPLS